MRTKQDRDSQLSAQDSADLELLEELVEGVMDTKYGSASGTAVTIDISLLKSALGGRSLKMHLVHRLVEMYQENGYTQSEYMTDHKDGDFISIL